MFAVDTKTNEIFLYDDIGPAWLGMIDATSVIAGLKQMEGKRVLLRINSPGGSVDEGAAIYNAIKRHPGGVDVAIDGLAASIAGYIAMAGEKVTIAANARMMIHDPWTMAIVWETGMKRLGMGYRFRGSGFLQLTGHSNFYHAGQALGEDFVMQPELVRTPKYAAMTAGWFWQTHKLNQYADSRDFVMMTKKINGGIIGLDDRIKHINHALDIIA